MRRHYNRRTPAAPRDDANGWRDATVENAATKAANAKLEANGRCPRCLLLLPHVCIPARAHEMPRGGYGEG